MLNNENHEDSFCIALYVWNCTHSLCGISKRYIVYQEISTICTIRKGVEDSFIHLTFVAALFITGGYTNSVEAWIPANSSSCSLPGMTRPRGEHTIVAPGLVCGGSYDGDDAVNKTCEVWRAGTGDWEEVVTNETKPRNGHMSWNDPTGTTFLVGGVCCLIDLDTSFVLTGGSFIYPSIFVTQYNANGFMKELPVLNTARSDHGCAAYYTNTNQPVIFRLETFLLNFNVISEQKGAAGDRRIGWIQYNFGHNRSPFVSYC